MSVHFVLQEQALDQENVRVKKNQREHHTNAKEEDELVFEGSSNYNLYSDTTLTLVRYTYKMCCCCCCFFFGYMSKLF